VPMMPVVRGEDETRALIVLYTVLLVALTLMPVVFGYFGLIYGTAALVLGAGFISLALRLWREAERRSALRTYLFSLSYLALLFCAMVLDARL
jgi:heme o synthase